jgi:hypothetical protein
MLILFWAELHADKKEFCFSAGFGKYILHIPLCISGFKIKCVMWSCTDDLVSARIVAQ